MDVINRGHSFDLLVRFTEGRLGFGPVRRHRTRFFTTPGHEAAAVVAGAAVIAEEREAHTLVDESASPARSPKNATTRGSDGRAVPASTRSSSTQTGSTVKDP